MTVDTKNWTVSIDDGKIEKLMDAYNAACWHCIHAGLGPEGQEARDVKMALETALVGLGILEPDEEPGDDGETLDYTNSAQHFDEWAADQRFDMYRDLALMGYEY